MSNLFWTGKISFPLKLIINIGSIIACLTGNARNISAMKQRIKNGYNGKYSNYIHRFDELGSFHYKKIANKLIEKVKCSNMEAIDVGCGTGILSLIALKQGVKKMICVDISELMLKTCKIKILNEGYNEKLITFYEADAEQLPFNSKCFDIVFLNMILGMIPNQQATIIELARILRSKGTIALSTHGPSHYSEAVEATLRVITKRYFISHRFEFWPIDENKIRILLINAGLKNIQIERLSWIDKFENGSEVFDFFAATSSLWWYDRLPSHLREKETVIAKEYFQRKKIKSITSDIIFAYGSIE